MTAEKGSTMATVGVLCARGRVEENALMAALAEAGIVSALFPPADEPLPVGPMSPSPSGRPFPVPQIVVDRHPDPADRPRGARDLRCARSAGALRRHRRHRRPPRRGIGSGRARPAASADGSLHVGGRRARSRRGDGAAGDAAAAGPEVDADRAPRPGRRRGGPRAPRRAGRRRRVSGPHPGRISGHGELW